MQCNKFHCTLSPSACLLQQCKPDGRCRGCEFDNKPTPKQALNHAEEPRKNGIEAAHRKCRADFAAHLEQIVGERGYPDPRAMLNDFLCVKGVGMRPTAEELGVSFSWVRAQAHRYGLAIRGKGERANENT